jgi:hypothetical protein
VSFNLQKIGEPTVEKPSDFPAIHDSNVDVITEKMVSLDGDVVTLENSIVAVDSRVSDVSEQLSSLTGIVLTGASPWATSSGNTYTTNSGNVGIGNNFPTNKLDIKDSLATTSVQTYSTFSSGAVVGKAEYILKNASYETKLVLDGTDAQRFKIVHGSITALSINQDGSIGIGTTNPSATLDISGDLRTSRVTFDTANVYIKQDGNDITFHNNISGGLTLDYLSDKIARSTGTTKGDMVIYLQDNAPVRLAPLPDNTIYKYDSASINGVSQISNINFLSNGLTITGSIDISGGISLNGISGSPLLSFTDGGSIFGSLSTKPNQSYITFESLDVAISHSANNKRVIDVAYPISGTDASNMQFVIDGLDAAGDALSLHASLTGGDVHNFSPVLAGIQSYSDAISAELNSFELYTESQLNTISGALASSINNHIALSGTNVHGLGTASTRNVGVMDGNLVEVSGVVSGGQNPMWSHFGADGKLSRASIVASSVCVVNISGNADSVLQASAFNKNFGTTPDTVAEGNHIHTPSISVNSSTAAATATSISLAGANNVNKTVKIDLHFRGDTSNSRGFSGTAKLISPISSANWFCSGVIAVGIDSTSEVIYGGAKSASNIVMQSGSEFDLIEDVGGGLVGVKIYFSADTLYIISSGSVPIANIGMSAIMEVI